MSLPPRGSLQDRVLREVIERERYAEFRKFLFLGTTVALAARGAPPHLFGALEEELSLAIFQTAFDPEAVAKRLSEVQAQARQRRNELLRDARLLAQVASYDETREDQTEAQHADVFARRVAERAAQKDE